MNFTKGLFTFIWKYWALSIKNAIASAAGTKNSWYQIPKIKTVASAIFDAPTAFLTKLDKSYCLNSKTILSYLKTHTIITDIETISCAKIEIFSIEAKFNVMFKYMNKILKP